MIAHPDFADASPNPLPANIAELDARTGQILDVLDETGVADNTTWSLIPGEKVNLMDSDLTVTWVIGKAIAPLMELAASAQQYPHVPVGAEFEGYGS
jgi:hypothetical protein